MRDSKGSWSVRLRPRKAGKVVDGADGGSYRRSFGRNQTPPSTGRQRKSKETRKSRPAQRNKTAVTSKGKGRKGAGARAKTVTVKDLKPASRRNKQTTKGRKETTPTKGARSVKVKLAKQKKAEEKKMLAKERQKKSVTQKDRLKADKEQEEQEASVIQGVDQLQAQEGEATGNVSSSSSVVTRNVRKGLLEPIKTEKMDAGADGKETGSANSEPSAKPWETILGYYQQTDDPSELVMCGIDDPNRVWQLGALRKLNKHIESGELSEGVVTELCRSGFVEWMGKISTFNEHLDDVNRRLMPFANASLETFYRQYRQSLDIKLPPDSNLTLDLPAENSSAQNETLPCLPIISRLLYSRKAEVLADACEALKNICDKSKDFIQKVLDAGVCRRLVDLLAHTSRDVVRSALMAVGNIAYGGKYFLQVVVDCSAIPHLHNLLSNSDELIRRRACWISSIIAAGNRAQILALINENIIPLVIDLLEDTSLHIQRGAVWTIAQITRATDASREMIRYVADQGWIEPFCCSILGSEDVELLQMALRGLSDLLDKLGKKKYSAAIEACGGLDKIRSLQNHSDSVVGMRAGYIIANYF